MKKSFLLELLYKYDSKNSLWKKSIRSLKQIVGHLSSRIDDDDKYIDRLRVIITQELANIGEDEDIPQSSKASLYQLLKDRKQERAIKGKLTYNERTKLIDQIFIIIIHRLVEEDYEARRQALLQIINDVWWKRLFKWASKVFSYVIWVDFYDRWENSIKLTPDQMEILPAEYAPETVGFSYSEVLGQLNSERLLMEKHEDRDPEDNFLTTDNYLVYLCDIERVYKESGRLINPENSVLTELSRDDVQKLARERSAFFQKLNGLHLARRLSGQSEKPTDQVIKKIQEAGKRLQREAPWLVDSPEASGGTYAILVNLREYIATLPPSMKRFVLNFRSAPFADTLETLIYKKHDMCNQMLGAQVVRCAEIMAQSSSGSYPDLYEIYHITHDNIGK